MAGTYIAEAIDLVDLASLFTTNWDQKSGTEIPVPEFAQSDRARFDPSTNTTFPGRVNIKLGDLVETQVGQAYEHTLRRLPVTLDLWSMRRTASAGGTGRQYLYDMKQEIRRILYANKHSLTNWQIIRFERWHEVYADSAQGRFHIEMSFSLEDDGVALPSELIDEDVFTRADADLGAEWTDVAGDWEVVSNKAALQDATANAHSRFVGTTPLPASLRLQVTVTTATDMEAGILFRWQDSTNYWTARLVEESSVQYVRLIVTVAGSETLIGQIRGADCPGWTAGGDVELAVDTNGDLIQVQVDGLETIRVRDATLQNETDHGLFSDNDQNTRFDCFRVHQSGGTGR